METIAIVGPSGVLGQALVPELLEYGYNIKAIARNPVKTKRIFGNNIRICTCDLLSDDIGEKLSNLLTDCDALIHIATSIPKNRLNEKAWETNTLIRTRGTHYLIQAALMTGIKKYLQQSIIMAYPDCGSRWITEDTALDNSEKRKIICEPVSIMEHYVKIVSPEKMHWSILRGGLFVGPDTFQDVLLKNLADNKLSITYDGNNYISPVHVKDMAHAFVLALQNSKSGSIYNINDEPVTYLNYVQRIVNDCGYEMPHFDTQISCRLSHRCSNIKAKLELGWKPTHSIYPKIQKPDDYVDQ